VLDDLRHDAVDELVVDLDAALLERLLEHVVDEGRLRLVARFVAREGGDRRVERLVVEQREERHPDRRVGALDAGPRRGEARILDVADPDAGRDVGGVAL
jgi:hypothetical protein